MAIVIQHLSRTTSYLAELEKKHWYHRVFLVKARQMRCVMTSKGKSIRYHPFGIGTDIVFGMSVPESIADTVKYRILFGIPTSAHYILEYQRLILTELV